MKMKLTRNEKAEGPWSSPNPHDASWLAGWLLRCLLTVKLHCKSSPALTAALRSHHVQYAL